MQFAADDHVELLRAMSEVNATAATTTCAQPAPELAFLPNLMPTYVTQHEGGNVHMFSLVHQVPQMQQGWRLLLRGLDLKPLLCDKTTIQILELVGGVDWKHIPGSQKKGSLGVFFHVPSPTTMLRIKNLTATDDPDGIAASLDNLTLAASAEDDRDQHEEPQEPQEPQEAQGDTIDIEVLVEQNLE